MKSDTIEEIKTDIKRLGEMIKADRAARGVPPEPPEDFVSVAMAWTLYEKCEPLLDYAITYAEITDKANKIVELPAEEIEYIRHFRPYAELIPKVKEQTLLKVLGGALGGLISTMENSKEYEHVDDTLTSLHINLTFLKGEYHPPRLHDFTHKFEANKEEEAKYKAEIYEEYERLKDEEYFKEEYKRLTDHYESIRHLY